MSNDVVVITGGGSGIGLATARLFVQQGWRAALIDSNREGLEIARKELGVWTAACDVADYESVQSAGAAILQQFGWVDVLVNNAGVSQPKQIVELTRKEWERTIDVNLGGAYHWCKALLPAMLARRRGSIINISSVSAKHGGGHGTVSKACYAASKAGLLGFTRGLAREAAPHVRVNAICPGMIETPMTHGLIARAEAELRAMIPLGRLGTPDDVAGTVWFLASAHAGYITGEVIDVNGGLYID